MIFSLHCTAAHSPDHMEVLSDGSAEPSLKRSSFQTCCLSDVILHARPLPGYECDSCQLCLV